MREPYQVLVLVYREGANELRYLVAKRSQSGIWQFVSGGGETGETLEETARRELQEEAGLTPLQLIRLDSTASIPKHIFPDHEHWQQHPYVISQYAFGAKVAASDVTISPEHSEMRWCSYAEATELLHFDSNKVALWELHARLTGEM